MPVSEITKQMTPDEYITLAGKYCERMEWNHDAIPELAECLEDHDKRLTAFLDGERIARQYAVDKGVELQRENFNMKEAGWRVAKALECARGHGYHGGGPALAEWAAYFPKSDSVLPNVV